MIRVGKLLQLSQSTYARLKGSLRVLIAPEAILKNVSYPGSSYHQLSPSSPDDQRHQSFFAGSFESDCETHAVSAIKNRMSPLKAPHLYQPLVVFLLSSTHDPELILLFFSYELAPLILLGEIYSC